MPNFSVLFFFPYLAWKGRFASNSKLLDVFKSLSQAVNYFCNAPSSKTGQVDSPESLETPEITEMTEILINVTKCLTKLKKTLNKFCLRKILHQKTVRITFSMDSGFLNTLCGKKRNPEMPEVNRKLSQSKSTQC